MVTADIAANRCPEKILKILGRTACSEVFYVGISSMRMDPDIFLSMMKDREKSMLLCYLAGDLSQPTEVNEQYLLDLERAFYIAARTQNAGTHAAYFKNRKTAQKLNYDHHYQIEIMRKHL